MSITPKYLLAGLNICIVQSKMLQKVLLLVKTAMFLNIFIQNYLAHNQGQQRLKMSSNHIGTTFELKRRGVDIEEYLL